MTAHFAHFGRYRDQVDQQLTALSNSTMIDLTDPTHIIVLQPGSAFIRYGLAHHECPKSLPNVIAYRCSPTNRNDHDLVSVSKHDQELVEKRRDDEAKETQSTFKKRFKSKYNSAKSTVMNSFFNSSSAPIFTQTNCLQRLEPGEAANHRWVFTDARPEEPSYVIGDRALHLAPDSNYALFYPIHRGQLSSDPLHATYSAVNALYQMFSHIIFNELEVEKGQIHLYGVSLAIPDVMCHREIVDLHDLLLKQIGVGAVFVHRESVLACFGAGLSTCCVVDIGKEKTQVCCIREGIVIPNTSVVSHYGADHFTESFLYFLRACSGQVNGFEGDHYFPLKDINISLPQHFAIVDSLKINACAFPPSTVEDAYFDQCHEFFVTDYQSHITSRYRINMTQAGYLAPLCLFQTALFGPGAYFERCHKLLYIQQDIRPFDYLNKDFMESAPTVSGRAKDLARKAGIDDLQPSSLTALDGLSDVIDEGNTHIDEPDGRSCDKPHSVFSASVLPVPLHEMVRISVESIDPELRRVLLSQILVVGGTAKIKGFSDEFEDRLLDSVACYLNESDRIEVVQNSKESDVSHLSWVGAAILAQTTGCWVMQREWNNSAIGSHTHLLRAKVPFSWDI